jgi:hypothetical protein
MLTALLSDAVDPELLSTTKNRIMRIGSVGHNPQVLPPSVRAGGAREGRGKMPLAFPIRPNLTGLLKHHRIAFYHFGNLPAPGSFGPPVV